MSLQLLVVYIKDTRGASRALINRPYRNNLLELGPLGSQVACVGSLCNLQCHRLILAVATSLLVCPVIKGIAINLYLNQTVEGT